MVRNFITQKPYSQEKIKLNFQNSTLLAGWDENKECDNSSIILHKDGCYYLGIMHKDYRKLLKIKMPKEGDCYEKMVYKLLPGAYKMLPHVFFAESHRADFNPSNELLEKYKKGTHIKGENFSIDDCHALIDFFKASINRHEDWKQFDFHFSETSTYRDISDFYKEVDQQGYKISYSKVSVTYINQLVEDGKLFLFKIYNKDFSPLSKGTPNMHTLYWKALFSARNLNDVVYKLNGQAEVFYRKKSLSYAHPTHAANLPIRNKNKLNEKKESVFNYDLIKNRRYTVDKFMLHIPITMNFKCKDRVDVNMDVKEYIKQSEDFHIIGIDRGERHLLYLVVIDSNGHIKEQFSLNQIVNEYQGKEYHTNYHQLLEEKETKRLEARQSWQTIETIKELKEGYLSQVIHKIVQLMIEYNAMIVLEDLNLGFMQGRQKVEKQVYQKFEKMLIDKLCYLVDKKADMEQPGGLYNAYQLAVPESKGKQNGFLFYIPAWNTSKIDPVTGFVNLLDTRYESTDKAKAFFSKFSSIRYNAAKGWYEFAIDYNIFTTKAEGTKTDWVICSQGERIENFRNPEKNNQWDSMTVYPTELLNQLFIEYRIDREGNLKEAISMQDQPQFFKDLLHALKLTLQMRNSVINTDIDFLISPVADENGHFYDSRHCGEELPKNADANGAYNIARKGLMMVQQIKKSADLNKLRFDLSNKSWLNFAQQKPYQDE